MQGVIRVLLGVGEEQGEIICDGFVNPLVAVARPGDDVAPPLVRDFVIRDQLRKVLLAGSAQPGPLLGFRTQEGISGNIEQAGPALPGICETLRLW